MAKYRTIEERLSACVRIEDDGCWIWTLAPDRSGYGRMKVGTVGRIAHRAVYEALVGPIREGFVVDHICRVRSCVNPAHLRLLTPAENTLIGESFSAKNRRKTHCPQGHAYDNGNTLVLNSGSRACRACRAGRSSMRRAFLAGREVSA